MMIRRAIAAAALLLLSTIGAIAQSGCPTIVTGAVLTAGQWQSCFQAKQDALGFTPLNRAGGVMTGPLITMAGTTASAPLRISIGVAPSSPINGDMWTTTSGVFARINGATLSLGATAGPLNGVPAWDAGGLLVDSGLRASSATVTTGTWQGTAVAVGFGGTGSGTAGGARTNLGLGTISTQNANGVAITGGTITGMPTPTAAADVATKAYVDATSTGLTIHSAVDLATAAVLPNSPTYSNGASGVGATLTAGANAAIVVDGVTASSGNRVLVRNQASALQNGAYTVTTVGSGAAAWVLTRATDFDTAGEMTAGSYFAVTSGAVNTNKSFVLQTTVVTVGTDAVNFTQFASGGVSSVTITPGAGIGTSGTCTITSTGSCVIAVAPAGSSGNVQYNNAGALGALTDTQLAARITPLNNVWTGSNSFRGNAFLGTGKPWVDVMSGANGCNAAIGGFANVANDTTAIQCQLTYIGSTLGGGILFIPRPGDCFYVNTTLSVPTAVLIQGTGQQASCISTNGVDIPALAFGLADAGASTSGTYTALRDIQIACGTSVESVNLCVFVGDNRKVDMQNVIILGGYRALVNHGVDGRYYNLYISAAADARSFAGTASFLGTTMTVTAVTSGLLFVGQTVSATGVTAGTKIASLGTGTGGTGTYNISINHTLGGRPITAVVPTASGSANLFSRGANWYIDCKFDSATNGPDFGVYIYAPYTTSTAQMENHFVGCDMSGPWASAGLAIDDSANPAGVPTAITWCQGCIISQGGLTNLLINQAVWTNIAEGALRFVTIGASGGTLTIGNSWGGPTAGGVVSGAGTDRLCSNNKNLTC